MRRLGNIVSRLTAASRAMQAANSNANFNDDGRLGPVTGFGSNPGELDARLYTATGSPAALVVVLHGCTQTASAYDRGSGWSQLAERHGFAVLFPQQRRDNNSNLCFNWFLPGDARRGRGEAASISQMVQHVAAQYGLDRSHTYITGLSAGGAMTSVVLACYPELFAGGAVIAGLPFASANTLPEALERMRGQGAPSRRELAARAMAAAHHRGSTPTLSVWHGTQDATVDRSNAKAIVDQWRDLHGLGTTAGVVDVVDGHRHEAWSDTQGRVVIESYDVQGMGHGTPLDTRSSDPCGVAGPHMLEAGICSTSRIASFWGLVSSASAQREPVHAADQAGPKRLQPAFAVRESGPGAVIEDALRAAGLMR
jgi:poly(hydroxyalkanoate) depolymerase family esterase